MRRRSRPPAGWQAPAVSSISGGPLLRLRRNPVDLLLDRLFRIPAAFQDTHARFDHLRMSTEIDRGVARRAAPQISVFADEVFHTPRFSLPGRGLPRPADRGSVLEPGHLSGILLHLLEVSEFPGAARAVQDEQL